MVKFENSRPVPLSEGDKENKKLINTHVDNLWAYVKIKFDNFVTRGDTHGGKLRNILETCGYTVSLMF